MDVLLDANVIIDLMGLGCFESVLRSPGFRFWVVENVKEEITYSSQRESLERALHEGRIGETQVEDVEELQIYAELKRVLADGEAASLAVAHHRSWAFVTYEKGCTEREARRLLGANRFLRTPRLLALAVQAGMVDLERLEAAWAMAVPADQRQLSAHLSTLLEESKQLLEVERERGELLP